MLLKPQQKGKKEYQNKESTIVAKPGQFWSNKPDLESQIWSTVVNIGQILVKGPGQGPIIKAWR